MGRASRQKAWAESSENVTGAQSERNVAKIAAARILARTSLSLTKQVLPVSLEVEVEMIRMRWIALALLCAATTAGAQEAKRDTSKLKKAAINTQKAVDKGAKDTKNAVVKGAKDTKKAVKKAVAKDSTKKP